MAIQRAPLPSRSVARAARPRDGRGRADLWLGYQGPAHRPFGAATAAATGRLVARHAVHTSAADFSLVLVAPEWMTRRTVSLAIADAVAELRAIDVTYSPLRRGSLVARLRRGEVSPEAYPPLADIVARCDAMRAATDGWFDAWAVPGGFDPGGLLKGWAVERAATRLRAAGITDYAVVSEADLVVRGTAPHGGPWRIAIHQPQWPASFAARSEATMAERAGHAGPQRAQPAEPRDPRRAAMVVEMTEGAVGTSGITGHRGHVVDPHTGEVVPHVGAAVVTGPDLATADAYATALFAAGPAGLGWFPTVDGYRMLYADCRPA